MVGKVWVVSGEGAGASAGGLNGVGFEVVNARGLQLCQ